MKTPEKKWQKLQSLECEYLCADKSLARPTSRCIFWWWEYFVWCKSCYI